eukprot:6358179-Amphidinium_carterae.1
MNQGLGGGALGKCKGEMFPLASKAGVCVLSFTPRSSPWYCYKRGIAQMKQRMFDWERKVYPLAP